MRHLGNKGEEMAVKYLSKKGYRIIRRNYKAHTGEIDIIAGEGETVVFVEVKTRRDGMFGLPHESVGARKQRKILETALHYMSGLKAQPKARFDIVSIRLNDGPPEIEHIKDAFEAGATGPF